ncbi:MAG: hypothetical protein JXR34_11460 [Bacteroidales bacterium]|nr:hypothetical protein [Bacteroidales bacterium]
MKLRETNLRKFLSQKYEISNTNHRFDFGLLDDYYKNELVSMYRKLGGVLDAPPTSFGAWDIVTKDFIVELDEEQHFNRYRELTLESEIYADNKFLDVNQYKIYCKEFESVCLKKASRGGYWKNDSTEKQFGKASENGDFSVNGSPRWKQRAFYDFCRDIFAVSSRVPVYRIAIYDKMALGVELGKALLKGDSMIFEHYLNEIRILN